MDRETGILHDASRSKHRIWARVLCGLVVTLLLVALAAGWWLPPLAAGILRRELAKRGCADTEVRVVAVSPTRAELGPVVLGRGADAFRIETVRLTYSLAGLARGRFKSVELVGVRATVRQRGAAWCVVGLEPLGAQYPAAAEPAKTSRGLLRLPFETLAVSSSTIQVRSTAGEVRMPVTGWCRVTAGSRLDFLAALYPEGQLINASGNFDLNARNGTITWETPDLDLALCLDKFVRPFLPAVVPPEFRIAGKFATNGQVSFDNGGAGPINVTARSADVVLNWGEAQARVAPLWFWLKAADKISPLSARASGTVREVVLGGSRYGGGETSIGDVDLILFELARGPTLEASGAFGFYPNPNVLKSLFPGWSVEFTQKGPRLCGLWNASREPGKAWMADLDLNLDEETSEMSFASVSPPAKLSGQVHFVVLASLDGDSLAASAMVSIKNLAGEVAATTVAVSEIGLWAALPPADAGSTSVSELSPGGQMASAAAWVLENGLEGGFVLTGGSFRHAAYGSCDELNVSLPLSWSPADGLRTPQTLDSPPPIQWRGLVVQDVRLKDGAAGLSAIDTSARLEARLAPEDSALAANLVAQASWAEGLAATVDVEVPPISLTEKEPLLAARLNAFPGATCAGQVGGQFRIRAEAGAPLQASGRVVVDKGELAYPAKKFNVKGIAGTVDFASLLPLRTPPAQRLVFTAAEVAGMPVDGGTLVFQIESPQSVFIEKGDISWAGGWLRGYAFRFNPARPDGDVVLYADAIDLSRFLSSFRNFKGEGSGILYGRLPFRVRNGVVRFADGFLISVPGQAGHLKLTEQDWLVTALDQTKMDPATLARVKQALTDFDFSVFRMDLETGDPREAVLRVRLAGKASHDPALPPLDLEVNVRGPLDYLFNLGLRLAK